MIPIIYILIGVVVAAALVSVVNKTVTAVEFVILVILWPVLGAMALVKELARITKGVNDE